MLTEEYGKLIVGGSGPTDYSLIRPDMVDALRRYVFRGLPPGSFLTAVLENNFMQAAARADSDNIVALPAWAALIYLEVPGACHGSQAKVEEWLLATRSLRHAERASGIPEA